MTGRLRRVRGLAARTPLRVRLVVASVVLVMLTLFAAGAIALATLRSYLTGRVDDQLRSVRQPVAEQQVNGVVSQADTGGGRSGHGGEHDHEDVTALPSTYVVAVLDAHGAVAYRKSNLLDPGEPLPRFPNLQAGDVASGQLRFVTVGATVGDEDWRVLAAPVQLADGTSGTLLIAESLADVQNTVTRLTELLAVIGGGAVLLLAAVGYVTVRASLRPLREVERSAARIAGGDLAHRVPASDPRTEVGQLAAALNRMLGDIETAFAARAASEDRMRRFVADASHELRTPLTSIRGFAELYRQGAASEPSDVARLMTHIEDEATRMGLLVEDLLLLARLDQERPLARTPVDLLAVVTDSVRAARATQPDRTVTLAVESSGQPPVVIGDEARLRQVLANLLTNALTHTPVSAAVAVRLTSHDTGPQAGHVVVEVADQGPGMAPEAASRAFERFYRTDAARGRSGGSTGLGLAIVAALVAGHAGRVTLDTAPGAGARFVVTLPFAG